MMRSSALLGVLCGSFAIASCGNSAGEHAAAGAASSGAGGSTTGTSGVSQAATSGSTSSGSSGAGGTNAGSVTGVSGGMLDTLSFAIVGDTRPPNEDDTTGYPTAIITKIWQDVEAASPRPPFAITTGDYQFSNPTGMMASPQLDLYLTARKAFSNVTFPAMGNHECTGATASNCGPGSLDGLTANYNAYNTKMLAPLKVAEPYYTVNVASTKGAWTAKFVIVAANYWSTAQGTWLAAELAKPTTYTFVVRHEASTVTTTPGVSPSEALIAKYPYTLAIVGHSHEYRYEPSAREVIVGNGGAPLTGGSQYGYVIARQRSDGAMVFTSYEYATNTIVESFALKADGTAG